MASYEDRLKDYTDVKQRIALFYAAWPAGRLVTERAELWLELDPPRVFVWAKAYRTPDDPLPGDGVSWLAIPGTTNFTRGSEIENAQTSAWGRAIGSLGIGIAGGIGSLDEIEAKHDDGAEVETGSGSLIGTVTKGATAPVDMQLRHDPKGPYIGFALRQGRQRLQVVAVGALADALAPFLESLVDARVEVWGKVEMVPWRKGDRDMPPYRRLQLERIKTPDWVMPAPAEAETVELFPEPEYA